MRLQPKRPPGRADRKAAAYSAEIVQLRADGYTYEAIREALAEFGIKVSEATLRREVRRQQKRIVRAIPVVSPPSPMTEDLTLPAQRALPPGAPQSTLVTGREIAVRISVIVDAHFRLIVDGKSAPSETRRGGAQVLG